MNLIDITEYVTTKSNFNNLDGYINFCTNYLSYVERNIQTKIVSQNENHYLFFQYDSWGNYQITRPINSKLFYSINDFEIRKTTFLQILKNTKELNDITSRDTINRTVYTIQQSIGAALDALQPGESNRARKMNGDLFEHLVRLIIREIGIECYSGIVRVPVMYNEDPVFDMSYQHDLIIKQNDNYKILGTIKTSSKDRLGKMFVDKFLYNKMTETSIPHIAIIFNDVQRKRSNNVQRRYGVSATFLPGHFKAYTVKLNPLDGVYYCDIRPNMRIENILKDQIRTFDNLLLDDIWKLL